MQYIDIDKHLVPYEFDVGIQGQTFKFIVKYNYLYDFFTIDLHKDGEVIALGEKLIYGRPLFICSMHKDIPRYIVPFDLSGNSDRVTFDNLNERVFLYLVEGDDNDYVV